MLPAGTAPLAKGWGSPQRSINKVEGSWLRWCVSCHTREFNPFKFITNVDFTKTGHSEQTVNESRKERQKIYIYEAWLIWGTVVLIKNTSEVPAGCESTDTCCLNTLILYHDSMSEHFCVLPAYNWFCQDNRSVLCLESERGSMIYSLIRERSPD